MGYPYPRTKDEQPGKCFHLRDGKCAHCAKPLTIRGANSFEPEVVSWTYKSDYYECSDFKGFWITDKEYCTKACALAARKGKS